MLHVVQQQPSAASECLPALRGWIWEGSAVGLGGRMPLGTGRHSPQKGRLSGLRGPRLDSEASSGGPVSPGLAQGRNPLFLPEVPGAPSASGAVQNPAPICAEKDGCSGIRPAGEFCTNISLDYGGGLCRNLAQEGMHGLKQLGAVIHCLGRRGSGVQIAPPRPMCAIRSQPPLPHKARPVHTDVHMEWVLLH